MTDPRAPSDTELLSAAARGDDTAYGTLCSRHEAAARRLAAQLTRHGNVDDLVRDSFQRVLQAVQAGGGPHSAFRPYLYSTMRRDKLDTGLESDQRAAWRAWESLPDESRTLLWHLVVEEETPAQVAPLLGLSADAVSSRAVRARERLRQAFLMQHLARADNEECRAMRAKLGSYVRNALSARDTAAVEAHLAQCADCSQALAELRDVDGSLRLVIAPLLIGGSAVAAKYLAATHQPLTGRTTIRKLAARSAAPGAAAAASNGPAHLARSTRGTFSPAQLGVAATVIAACGIAAVTYLATADDSSGTAARRDALKAPVIAPVQPAVTVATLALAGSSTPPTTPTSSRKPKTSPAASRGASASASAAQSRARSAHTPRGSNHARPPASPPKAPPGSVSTVTRTVAVLPPAGFVAFVRVQAPSRWTLDAVTINGFAMTPDGGSTSTVWLLSTPMTITATGPAAPSAALTVTLSDQGRTTASNYPLT